LADSLKEIYIDGNDQLEDISVLATLKNLENINIINYSGVSLPDLSGLTKLRSFFVEKYYGGDKLKHIDGLSGCKSLKKLYVRSGAIEKLDLDFSKMTLDELEISGCSSIKDINAISDSKSLKILRLFDIPIKRLPANMSNMDSLRYINIIGLHRLSDISNLKKMKSLHRISINGAAHLTEIPRNFNTNTKMDSIDISYARGLRSAEGISYLRNLNLLDIDDVNPAFDIPSNLYTCENIQTIIVRISIESKAKDISMIRNFPKLKKLELSFLPFSMLPDEIFTNKNVEEFAIIGNTLLTDISSVVRFKKLKKLTISYNDKLIKIPDLKHDLSFVDDIDIQNNRTLVMQEDYKTLNKNWKIEKNGLSVN